MNFKKWIYSLVLLLFSTGYTHAIPNRSIKNALTGLKTVELAEEKPNSETLEKLKELTDVIEPQKLENLLKNAGDLEFDIIINRLHKDISIPEFNKVANAVGSLLNQFDNTIARLTGKSKFSLTGTGKYKTVKGHHPMAKKAFEGDLAYDYKEAFSVKVSSLEDAWKTVNQGIPQNIHGKITGQQNSLYSAWRKANPNKKLSLDEIADIFITVTKSKQIAFFKRIGKLSSTQYNKIINDILSKTKLLKYFLENPKLVDSWKVLREANLGDDIAKDITSLTKARRYMDNGLTIESGGIVKQADGTVIGKIDNTNVYNPGELKVKGEHSGRHFDPDDAGGAIVKKDWNTATIDQSGIDNVTTHLSRFEDIDGDNAFMIDRLNKIKNGEIPATDYDKRFYTHELEEYSRYKNKGIADGVNDEDFYYNAHTASLEAYSVNEIQSPLYHPK